MKLKHAFLVGPVLLLMAFSLEQKSSGKLRSFHSAQNKDTVVYHYDNEGRVSYYTAARDYRTSYEYHDHTITETTAGGSMVTMYLNSRGLVDSLTDIDPMRAFQNGKPSPHVRATRAFYHGGLYVLTYLNGGIASRNAKFISKKFVYDTAGYLLQETEYVNGQLWAQANSTVSEGNITSYSIRYFFNDTASVTNTVTGKEEIKVFQLGNRLFTMNYAADKANTLSISSPFGRCSKNLVMRMVDNSLPQSKDSTVYIYQYTFDHDQRVSGMLQTVKSTDPPEWNNDAVMSDKCTFTYY